MIYLKTILELYNLNINDLSDFNKRKLLLYGNINNIRNILDILKENKINITFKENASKFIEILLLSNGSNVLTIISNIKEDLGNKFNEINLNEVFKQYITIPSIFIKGLKVYEKELKDREVGEKISNTSPNKDNLIFGGYNNYLLNRELFINEGIDLGIVLSTCPSVLPESNRKIKQNLLKYHMYNINNNDLLKTLSALKAICPLDVIDQFIETGFYDYLLGCLTITLKGKNSEELYQLINAKRSGLSDEEMFLSYEVGNTGIRRKKRKLSVLGAYDSTGLSGIEEYHQVKREDLDNLLNEFELISDDVLNDSLIKKMDELFRKEDNVYNINGIIISRFKVLRFYTILLKNNLGNLENLKYVIFKNKILSQEEYKMVIDLLDNTLKTKDTKKSKRPVTEVIYISNEYVKHLIELLDDEFLSNNDCYVFDNIIINRRAVIGKLNAFFAYHRPGNNDEFNKLFGAIIGGENLGSENENKIKMILLQRVQSKLKMNGIGR